MPMFYPISILPDNIRYAVVNFNPMYFYIEQFRAVALYGTPPDSLLILKGSIAAILFFIFGVWGFLKTQDKFILYI